MSSGSSFSSASFPLLIAVSNVDHHLLGMGSFFKIFPFLQTNITSEMWASVDKGECNILHIFKLNNIAKLKGMNYLQCSTSNVAGVALYFDRFFEQNPVSGL